MCVIINVGKYAYFKLSFGEYMRYVKCLFCENRKKRGKSLCSFCENLYSPYQTEEWYSEIVKMEQLQRRITKTESVNYDVDHLSKGFNTFFGSSRPRGRPKTTPLVESFIQSVYSVNLSIREITKLCNTSGLSVSRETVRSVVNRLKLTNNY